jgi:hypothetical protein
MVSVVVVVVVKRLSKRSSGTHCVPEAVPNPKLPNSPYLPALRTELGDRSAVRQCWESLIAGTSRDKRGDQVDFAV